jgi:hypothetical protein
MQKKDKKNSGWYTPKVVNPTMKYSDAHARAFAPTEEYDEWENWKDGFRYDSDDSHWRSEMMRPNWNMDKVKAMNKKLEKHFNVRKKRKYKQFLRSRKLKPSINIISNLSSIK